jgi:putative transposase
MDPPDSDPDTFAITPFYKQALANEYRRCWLPVPANLSQQSISSAFQWFEHDTFTCADPSQIPFRIPENKKLSTRPKSVPVRKQKKPKKQTKPKSFGRKKKLPSHQVHRTRKIRLYPTSVQKQFLQMCMAACRQTYNWALYKVKVMRECGFRIDYSRFGIRKLVVPDRVIPKRHPRLCWLSEVPSRLRAQAAYELSDAFINGFQKRSETGQSFDIKFRSVFDGQQSITFEKKCLAKKQKEGFIHLCATVLDPIRVREPVPETDSEMQIVFTRSGKYYLHVSRIVDKVNQANDHVVAIDPGIKPAIAYYSPTKLDAGFIGTEADVDKLLKIGKRSDHISSLLSGKMSHHKRWKLRRRRFKLNEKVRNRVEQVLNHACKYVCTNYGTILLPTFPVSRMIRKRDRRINCKSVRNMLSWRHASFRKKMADRSEVNGNHLRMVGEAYTSKTCGNCGRETTIADMRCTCRFCNCVIHRQLNGPRNIFLKHIESYL